VPDEIFFAPDEVLSFISNVSDRQLTAFGKSGSPAKLSKVNRAKFLELQGKYA
jgi:hypothetical protein